MNDVRPSAAFFRGSRIAFQHRDGLAGGNATQAKHQPQMEPTPKKNPWYHVPLPNWFPGWLVACLAVGTSTAITFHFGLDGLSWKAIAGCFAAGFGFMLAILTLVQNQAKPPDRDSGLYPPLWIRLPVWVALAVGVGATWVDTQRLNLGSTLGSYMEVHGPGVVALGIGAMILPVPGIVRILGRKPVRPAVLIGGVIALLEVAAGLGFAVVRIIQIYA